MASNYGWSKKDILEQIYPDEAVKLAKLIQERQSQNYLALLAIAHNPHSKNPKKLWRILEKGMIDKKLDNQLDIKGLERLKKKLNKK